MKNHSRFVKFADKLILLFCCAFISVSVCAVQFFRFRNQYWDIFYPVNSIVKKVGEMIPLFGRYLILAGERGYAGACAAGGLVGLVLLVFGWHFLFGKGTLRSFLYRKRYYVAAVIVILCVICEFNNTSLFLWQVQVPGDRTACPIWGLPRPVRGDEWCVWSALTISQGESGFQAINPLMEGGGVDVTWVSMGGLPAFNPAAVFKPLYCGFLRLGTSRGFSFLWIMRCVLLFFVSFAFAMRISKENKYISLMAAFLFCFAPYVQWWFSQSISEILIFGQGMMLAMQMYVSAGKRWERWALSAALAYSFGCLVMIGYPSWIISVLYLIVPVLILFLVQGRKNLSRMDAVRLLTPFLIVIAWLLVIVYCSRDALQSVKNSIYPGQRLFTGGKGLQRFFGGLFDAFFIYCNPESSNPSELSTFISFAPAGMILSVIGMLKQKKAKPIQIVLIAVEAFFICFSVFGVPKAIAKLTLLSQCTRSIVALGLADILLLISALSDKPPLRVGSALFLTVLSTAINAACYSQYYLQRPYLIPPTALLYALAFAVIYFYSPEQLQSKKRLCFVICMIMLFATGLVNPIQKGIECVDQVELVQALRQVDDEEDSLYLMESYYPVTNLPLMAGKRTYDSSHVYANVDKWMELDPEGAYINIYNRMAHVELELVSDDTSSFELIYGDRIKVNLSMEEIERQGINYLISEKEYAENTLPGCRLIPVGEGNGYIIYKVDSLPE